MLRLLRHLSWPGAFGASGEAHGAAILRGQTLTDFVVQAGEETATKVLERAGVVVLSAQDSTAFVDALLNPPVPGLRLTAAATRYLAIIAP